MTDTFRALCAELADSVELLLEMRNSDRRMQVTEDRLTHARAALAEPEPPADGEVVELVAELRHFVSEYQQMRGLDPEKIYSIQQGHPEKEAHLRSSQLIRAADFLERLAEPEPVGPSVEELAQLIYERAMAPAAVHCKVEVQPSWVSRGNSIAQDDARDCARAVLARWGRR